MIILDNLQTILAENKFSGNYQNQFQNYSEFFKNIGELPHQSCLIFNSWESPLEIINLTDLKTPVRIMSLNGIGETTREIFQAQNLSDFKRIKKEYSVFSIRRLQLEVLKTEN